MVPDNDLEILLASDQVTPRSQDRAGPDAKPAMPLAPKGGPYPRIPPRATTAQRLERLTTEIGLNFDRAAAAYHEAGHAVAGLWFGWVIGQKGIEIDTNQRCNFGCAAFAYTIEARAVVAMAGWLAERKWHGQGSANWDDDLIHVLNAHSWGQIIVGSDEQQVVKALVGERDPENVATDEFLLGVHAFREQAMALMSRRPVWRAVRQVARALLANGKLSDIAVVKAIDKDDFLKVSHGRWTAGS